MSAAAEFPWTPSPKEELRPLFENAPVGLAKCHRLGDLIPLNSNVEQILAGSAKTAGSLGLADLFPAGDHSRCERLLRELFAHERDSFELCSKTPAGDPLRYRVWRVPEANGAPDYALVLAELLLTEEVGEKHAAVNQTSAKHDSEPRLSQVEKLEAVGRLAGGVAHDFSNLLTGVLLYCDLLMANLAPGDKTRRYVEEIRNAGMQATGVVSQLLALVRPAMREARPVSINEIVDGMRNLLVRLIGENIGLELHLDPNLGLVKMDPTETQQILLNLVLNARDALPQGGSVTIKTSNSRVQILPERGLAQTVSDSISCVLIQISDNGTGMDAHTREHLFEAFFTTKAEKGTGLGLATVYDIVTRNGGLIHVDSAPGNGTRITVLLPRIVLMTSKAVTSKAMTSNATTLQKNDRPVIEQNEGVFPIEKEAMP